jgi:hypothetical protein
MTQKEKKWKYININPTDPNLHVRIKLHKQNTPIRPIINWRSAPAYKLVKYLTRTLHNCLHLPNILYNIQNSKHLTTDLQSIEIDKDVRMCSFDIENMYTNIPKLEVINIIENITENHTDITKTNQKETINILKTVMEQNYFQFNQQYYKQTEGLAMGVPTSTILAKVYI